MLTKKGNRGAWKISSQENNLTRKAIILLHNHIFDCQEPTISMVFLPARLLEHSDPLPGRLLLRMKVAHPGTGKRKAHEVSREDFPPYNKREGLRAVRTPAAGVGAQF